MPLIEPDLHPSYVLQSIVLSSAENKVIHYTYIHTYIHTCIHVYYIKRILKMLYSYNMEFNTKKINVFHTIFDFKFHNSFPLFFIYKII